MKSKLKNIFSEVIAFLIPIILLYFIYILLDLKSVTLLYSDLKAQYLCFFEYFKNLFQNTESIFYSFSNGLGSNMMGTIAYYLISPLNIVYLFFDVLHLPYAVIFLIALRFGLSGLTMHFYLRKHFETNSVVLYLFSTAYALMMFNIVYYFNLMWFDVILYLPLVLYGIDLIIKEKSSLIYTLFLTLSIFSNYYMGFMTCIFCAIYFLYEFVLNKCNYKILLKFIIFSLLSGLMTCVILIPTFFSMQNTSKPIFDISNNAINSNFIPLLTGFTLGSFEKILTMDYIYLYCGMIIVVLGLLFFFNSKITLKEKIMTLIVISILVLCYIFNSLNLIWHCFTKPFWFNYRYAWVFSFFFILIAVKSYLNIKTIKKRYFILSFLVILGGLIFLMAKNSSFSKYYSISLVISFIYLIFLFFIALCKNKKINIILELVMVFVVLLELLMNADIVLDKYGFNTFKDYNYKVNILKKEYDELLKMDNSFYRTYKNFRFTENDSFLFNSHEINSFNSSISAPQKEFFNKLGVTTSSGSVKYYYGETPFIDSLLGVKYMLLNKLTIRDLEFIKRFTYSNEANSYYTEENVYVYKNPYALSLGYMIPEETKTLIKEYKADNFNSLLDFQNKLALSLGGEDIFTLVPLEEGEYGYEFTVENYNSYYFPYTKEMAGNKVDVFVNNMKVKAFRDNQRDTYTLINNYHLGDKVRVELIGPGGITLYLEPKLYQIDYQKLQELYEKLSKNELKNLEVKKNGFKANINVSEDKKTLLLTLPYEKGWHFYVDGQKVEYYNALDGLIGIDLSLGEHHIEAKFYSPGFFLGLVISIITFIVSIICLVKEKIIINFLNNIYLKVKKRMIKIKTPNLF